MTPDELKSRTKKFAIDIIKLAQKLPENRIGWIIENQLVKAATSVGANYRATCRARSLADFTSKITIVEEESDETVYWLEIIMEVELIPNKEVENLLKEGKELTAIFTSAGRTAKLNKLKGDKKQNEETDINSQFKIRNSK